ncbi:hypothetical protein DFH06DRAFT_1368557 [Mycena polygramma]|nr:hypothetical protein DFH06DRAFT_1368557 [Mycena polygramma]
MRAQTTFTAVVFCAIASVAALPGVPSDFNGLKLRQDHDICPSDGGKPLCCTSVSPTISDDCTDLPFLEFKNPCTICVPFIHAQPVVILGTPPLPFPPNDSAQGERVYNAWRSSILKQWISRHSPKFDRLDRNALSRMVCTCNQWVVKSALCRARSFESSLGRN